MTVSVNDHTWDDSGICQTHARYCSMAPLYDQDDIDAAQAALDTHAALRRVHEIEPESDDEGMPYDHDAWIDWYEFTYQPAYQAWNTAMDELEAALGDQFPGRHPYNFVPVCEQLTGGDAA